MKYNLAMIVFDGKGSDENAKQCTKDKRLTCSEFLFTKKKKMFAECKSMNSR